MPPKKLRQVAFKIDSADHFLEKTSLENKKLICKWPIATDRHNFFDLGIDVHLAWCGACESMEQTYRNMFVTLDEDFKRMEFFSASEEFIPEEIRSELEFGRLTCKPRFILFFEGEKMCEIDGADCTKLAIKLRQHLPALDDE